MDGGRWIYACLGLSSILLAACSGERSRVIDGGVPESVRLIPGKYDIPFHLEPPREIRLIAGRIGLDRSGGLGGEMSPGLDESDLKAVKRAPKPLRILAYKYRARPVENLHLPLDPAEVAAAGLAAYCSGDGCVRFYIKGEVVSFLFRSPRESAAYETALVSHLNRFSSELPVRDGVSYISDNQAVLRKGGTLFVVSSWAPTTVEAILAELS